MPVFIFLFSVLFRFFFFKCVYLIFIFLAQFYCYCYFGCKNVYFYCYLHFVKNKIFFHIFKEEKQFSFEIPAKIWPNFWWECSATIPERRLSKGDKRQFQGYFGDYFTSHKAKKHRKTESDGKSWYKTKMPLTEITVDTLRL